MHQAMDLLIHLQILLTFSFCLIQRFFLEHYTFENFFSTFNFFFFQIFLPHLFSISVFIFILYSFDFFLFLSFFPPFPSPVMFFSLPMEGQKFVWLEGEKKTQFVKASYKVTTYGSKTINLHFASPETFPEKKEKKKKKR